MPVPSRTTLWFPKGSTLPPRKREMNWAPSPGDRTVDQERCKDKKARVALPAGCGAGYRREAYW